MQALPTSLAQREIPSSETPRKGGFAQASSNEKSIWDLTNKYGKWDVMEGCAAEVGKRDREGTLRQSNCVEKKAKQQIQPFQGNPYNKSLLFGRM